MEIKIDPELVNKVVAEAIVKSSLGQLLEKSINEKLKDVITGYRSPVEEMVKKHVFDCIRKVLDENYKETIIKMVAEKLSKEHVESIVDASVDKAMNMLRGER